MVYPTVQVLTKKPANDPLDEKKVAQNTAEHAAPTYGIWSSGLGVSIISGFLFPFLGVPATLVAVFAYVDLKTDDLDGYNRKSKLARRLGIAALVIGLVLVFLMITCKIVRYVYGWDGEDYHDNDYNWGKRHD